MRLLFVFLAAAMVHFIHSSVAYAEAPNCTLASEGIFNGWWVKHRIVLDENVVYGANDVDSIISQLDVLRDQGICR